MTKRGEAYEPFYLLLKEWSDGEKWMALRDLIDNLVADTERNTIDDVIKIIYDREQAYCDWLRDERANVGVDKIRDFANILKVDVSWRKGKMTRREAIEILKSKLDGKTDTSYEWVEAVGMAINALKDEQTVLEKLGWYDTPGEPNREIEALKRGEQE